MGDKGELHTMDTEQSKTEVGKEPHSVKQPETGKQPAPPVLPPMREKKPMGRVPFAVLTGAACLALGFIGPAALWATGAFPQTVTTNQAQTIVSQEGELISKVAADVGPSVVSIVTETAARTYWGTIANQEAAGTGIIISKDGYIVTNKHVVAGSTTIEVITSDGTSYKNVKLVGSDTINDVAFLKVEGVTNLKAATLGDSSQVKVGQKVIAIGNALGEYQNTVTAGIVSALSRPVTAADETGQGAEQLENLLQTDAAINPGNSGGPLVNLSGEVIGINTAVASDAEGIGFSIPINDVKGMASSVLKTGKITRPYLGVRYVSLTPDAAANLDISTKQGAYILASEGSPAIVSGSPAEKAGLREKDIITKVNKTSVDSQHPLSSLLAAYAPGDTVTLTVLRDGKEQTIKVTLDAYPTS